MYILSQKIKNKLNIVGKLKFNDLDYNNSSLNIKCLKKGYLKHNPSSVKEWYNSVYNFNNNYFVKTLPLKDRVIDKLLNVYFNINQFKKYNNLFMGRVFVGKPEIKHFNNKINITLYIFNKWISYFYNFTNVTKTSLLQKDKHFATIENKLFSMSTLLLKHYKLNDGLIICIKYFFIKVFKYDNDFFVKNLSLNKEVKLIYKDKFNFILKRYLHLYLYIFNSFFNFIGFPKVINIMRKVLLYDLKENRINNLNIILGKLRRIYLTKLNIKSLALLIRLMNLHLIVKKMLKSIIIIKWYKRNISFIRYIFNIKNILIMKNILNKLYNTKIEINIINLKYLYLDGNILASTVVRKLKDRKVRVLRIIRMALKLSKKPYINKFYSNWLNVSNLDTTLIKKDFNLSIHNNNIPLNNNLISKPVSYKSRIIFYYLKHKITSGIKLQGTGRLTKRLTASRSISKSMGKGSLKNKASSYSGLSTVVLRGYVKSNLQYVNINSYNRIGAYGIKSWISNN
jgi:hypothetical protein